MHISVTLFHNSLFNLWFFFSFPVVDSTITQTFDILPRSNKPNSKDRSKSQSFQIPNLSNSNSKFKVTTYSNRWRTKLEFYPLFPSPVPFPNPSPIAQISSLQYFIVRLLKSWSRNLNLCGPKTRRRLCGGQRNGNLCTSFKLAIIQCTCECRLYRCPAVPLTRSCTRPPWPPSTPTASTPQPRITPILSR